VIETFTLLSAFIALLSIFKEIKHKNTVFWSFTVLLIIFDGLRWEMGTDWHSYYTYFSVATDLNVYGGFEFGYRLYTTLIRSVTDNYSIYLLVTTAIIYVGIFYTVFKVTNHSFISMFYLAGTIPWYSGSLRQMMACVFFTLALKACIEKKFTYFLLLMIFGLAFHTTIIVFIPMYWLYGMSSSLFLLLFIALAVLSIFSRNLIYLLDVLANFFSFNKSFLSRLGGTLDTSNPLLGFCRKFLTIGGFIGFSLIANTSPLINRLQWKTIKFTLSLVSLSVILYYIGTYHINYVSSRVDIYISIISASVLIGVLDKAFTKRGNRLLLYFFVTALLGVFYYRLGLMDLFHPYTSLFYNNDFKRDLH